MSDQKMYLLREIKSNLNKPFSDRRDIGKVNTLLSSYEYSGDKQSIIDEITLILNSKLTDSIDIRDVNGNTPLINAIRCECLVIFDLLIAKNADVFECNDHHKNSPLHYACTTKYNVVFVEKLLKIYEKSSTEKMFDIINKKNAYGLTPLHIACQNNSLQIVEFLLKYQDIVEIDSRSLCQYTPLHYACQLDYIEIAIMLLSKGADVNALGSLHEIPIQLACGSSNNMRLAKVLIQHGAKLRHSDVFGNTMCHYACRSHNFDLALFFLVESVQYFLVNYEGNTLLHLSCIYNWTPIFKRVLQEKLISLAMQNRCGKTVLHYACEYNSIEFIKCIAGMKDDDPKIWSTIESIMMVCDSDLRNPLHFAALYKCDMEIIEFLLKFKNDNIICTDAYGKTPFHYACESCEDYTAVRLFINDDRLMYNLIEPCDQLPVHYATIFGCILTVEHNIRIRNFDVNTADANGKTPLHLAVLHGHLSIVKLLLKWRADVFAYDNNRRTVMHFALYTKHMDILHFLLHSLPFELLLQVDKFNHNPFSYACTCRYENTPESRQIMVMFIKHCSKAIEIDFNETHIAKYFHRNEHDPEFVVGVAEFLLDAYGFDDALSLLSAQEYDRYRDILLSWNHEPKRCHNNRRMYVKI